MIDFAQTAILPEDLGSPDLEYLYGIDSLLAFLENVLADSPTPPTVNLALRPDTDAQTAELLRMTNCCAKPEPAF